MPLKGGREHPTSKKQLRWAYAAESRGEVPKGTARRWSKRVSRRKGAGRQPYARRGRR
jgi:hypothetical protein